jgi:2-methylcitrate dehydratase PrpD
VWEVVNVSVKPLPACHFTHAAIDAAIRIFERGIAFDDIARVDVLVPAEVVKTVCEPEVQKRNPANSYEAQFSIPYLVGTGLIKGRLTLEDIEAPALYDAQVLDLASRTYYRVDPDTSFPKYFDGEVIVTLKNGQVVREREAVNRGAVDPPLKISFKNTVKTQPESLRPSASLILKKPCLAWKSIRHDNSMRC